MTVQTLPVAPLPLPGKPATPANAGTEADQQPFASVLQKKVEAGKSAEKPASAEGKPAAPESGDGGQTTARQGGSEAAKGQEGAEAAADKSTAAQAQPAPAEVAQDVLQSLFPWMQALQQTAASLAGQAAASSDDNKGAAAESLTLQDGSQILMSSLPALNVPQAVAAQAPQGAHEHAPRAADGLLPEDGGKNSGQNPALQADTTAKLAADTTLTTETTHTPTVATEAGQSQASFEQALQAAAKEQLASHAAQPTPAAAASVRLQAPVGSPAWQNELGDQVRWMSNQNESRAELILTPPSLGRIEVSLNISGDQASALFVSANPQVREALEGAMERLREVLANSGIALGQAEVGAESFQQNLQGEARQGGNSRGNGDTIAEGEALAAPAWSRQSNNMLDVFA